MRQILLIAVLLASTQVLAESWKGSTVKVPSGTLMCEYFAIENALELDSAGGAASLDETLEKSSCLYAPKELMVIVTNEATDTDGMPLAQVKIGRAKIWVAKGQVKCCFD